MREHLVLGAERGSERDAAGVALGRVGEDLLGGGVVELGEEGGYGFRLGRHAGSLGVTGGAAGLDAYR